MLVVEGFIGVTHHGSGRIFLFNFIINSDKIFNPKEN